MIDPNNTIAIQQLIKGQIEFPEIDYHLHEPLQLQAPKLQGAYTIIAERVNPILLEGLNWNYHGDIEWQNHMLQFLSDNILIMINDYQNNLQNELLTKIFVWIQLWGGISGRGVFVRGPGWPQNFNLDTYITSIHFILNEQFQEALLVLNTIYGMGTAFATKHIHFWSNDAIAPIYDRIIAQIVFGRKQVSPNQYLPYIIALDHLIAEFNNIQVNRRSIERSLFNWANTPLGLQWRNIRVQ